MKYLLLLLLAGCATDLTDEERAYRDVVDKGNWEACAALYERYEKPTFHMGHIHRRGHRVRRGDIRDDLTYNRCKMVMGESWMNY
jgi:hypothetical protein